MSAPASETPQSQTPRKLLGTLDVMALIIGIVIGAGIFSAPSLVAAKAATVTQLMVAWLLGGAISVAGALCYAELATSLEVGGVLFIIAAELFMTPDPAAAQTADPAAREATKWGLILVFVMLTYGGWNEAAYVSAEVIGPNKSLPRALFWSLAIITVTYILVNLAFIRALGLDGAGATDAVAADMLRVLIGDRGAQIISVLIAVSALTSVNATILLGARTIYAFGKDEPMFGFLGRWNLRHDGPTNALTVVGLISLALVGLGAVTRSGFATMVDYTAPVFWFFFVLTGLSLFVLRRKFPDRPRPFSVPFYPITPILFVCTCLYLLYSSIVYTGVGALVGIGVLAVGAVLLCFRGRFAKA